MPPFEDDPHAPLAQPLLKLIAAIEDRLASDRVGGGHAIVRAISHVVGVTVTAGWTLSHALVLLLHRARAGQDIAKEILAAGEHASKGRLRCRVFLFLPTKLRTVEKKSKVI